ncbi:MAG: GNAT family N-acetyltransferase [Muribaculaceae bacterium]|nr:GNAT family N-acetyltransferase [Muribaculaceae bacterium]
MDYNITDITDPNDSRLNRVKSLYFSSFPKEERRPWKSITEMLNNRSPFFKLRVITADGDNFAGFITLWNLPDALYVEHFAIEPEERSKGLGSRVISEITKSFGNTPVVLEVELPEVSEEAAERIQFYQRNGFEAMSDFPYFQPPYRPDLDIVPMMLMTSSPLPDPERFVIMLHTLVYNQ